MVAVKLNTTTFDAIIIGAGPAGATIATLLARSGHHVLLVDRARFPRDKVCGACLSGRGVTALKSLGLEAALQYAEPLHTFRIATNHRQAVLNTTGGVVLSRRTFDFNLVQIAQAAGATFLDGVTAKSNSCDDDHRLVTLTSHQQKRQVRGKLVINCGGLGKGSDVDESLDETIAPKSLIGLTTHVDAQHDFGTGEIHMAVARQGYVGLARQEDHRLNVSAALIRNALQEASSTSAVVRDIIQQAGFTPPETLENAKWLGTKPLTRKLQTPAGHRLFIVGDAAGYVEPFTGEGMTWAIELASLVEPLAVQAIGTWDDELIKRWSNVVRQHARRRQRSCRLLKFGLRRPWLVTPTIRILKSLPRTASPFLKAIHGPQQQAILHAAQ